MLKADFESYLKVKIIEERTKLNFEIFSSKIRNMQLGGGDLVVVLL